MNVKKVKEFVSEHKAEIAITVAAVLGGAIGLAIANRRNTTVTIMESTPAIKDLAIPELSVGTITELWAEGDDVMAIVNDITVKDLGKFSEELVKLDGVSEDTVITGIIGFVNKKVEA